MTDREALFQYRIKQARETLADAELMLAGGSGYRSAVNRAYYAMFYAVLALFLRFDFRTKTSKHKGVIAMFDQEFVHAGRAGVGLSRMLHRTFELRQDCDYREFAEISRETAAAAVEHAREFVAAIEVIVPAV